MVLAVLSGCHRDGPRAGHVILLGFDAMGAYGVQRASTPNFNYMIDNGAVSIHTRCVRPTSSSQNWMSMVSAAPVEMHTVFENNWKPGAAGNTPPALTNGAGLFPTIFDHIRKQRPDVRQFAYIEWGGETRMYDTTAFDRLRVFRRDTSMNDKTDVMRKAFSDYLAERPELMFVSVDIPDHIGHTFGHESEEYLEAVSQMDAFVGDFVRELEARGWMKSTVIIVTADHGGVQFAHGGDDIAEYEIPVIMYGKGVTKGKVMKHAGMIYDVGATVAALLGVRLPFECHGKLLSEAFEPADGEVYVPVPFVRPFSGQVTGDVTISADKEGAEIFFTLDGSEPSRKSLRYDGPLRITAPTMVRSVAYIGESRSAVADNWLYPAGAGTAPISYKLYKGIGQSAPDFTKFGKAAAQGYVNEFSLDEFDLADEDWFALLMTSHLIVPQEADYEFELMADDGARLYVDGEQIAAVTQPGQKKYAHVRLAAGLHPVKVEMWEYWSVQKLSLRVSIGGGPLQPLMPDRLSR